MRKVLATLLVIAMLLSLSAMAETELVPVTLGDFEYTVPTSWDTEYSEDGMIYHYETGNPFTGAYVVSQVTSIATTPGTEEVMLDTFIEGIAESFASIDFSIIDTIKCDNIGELPSKAAYVKADIDGDVFEFFCFVWLDWENIYAIVYSDFTASSTDVISDFNDLLTTLAEKSEYSKITIAGSGVDISEEISVEKIPSRITFTQDSAGEFDVSCVMGSKDYSVVDGGYKDVFGSECTLLTGDYTFLIESEKDWELTIEPLKEAEFEPLAMSGDYVTDIYTFEKSCIIKFDAEFVTSDNLFLHAFIEEKEGEWDKQYLLNELNPDGSKNSYKAILKIPKTSRVFFTIDFDEGNWNMDIAD